jgi:predicted RNase H-like HicB family nuclease
MKYAVIIEKTPNNYSAYAPDVPGCGSVGDTEEEVLRELKEALEFHFRGLREDGLPIPEPRMHFNYVETEAFDKVA